jgi:hypothetical protein
MSDFLLGESQHFYREMQHPSHDMVVNRADISFPFVQETATAGSGDMT